jgi:hypothetical protein
MDPQSNDKAGLNLPSPVQQGEAFDAAHQMPESAVSVPQNVGPNTAAQPPQLVPLPLPNQPVQSSVNTTDDVSSTTNLDVPSTAEDGDLIEKEWVTKAKQLVEQNQNDPYKQSKELTAFKASYLQKRYNKNIKLSE